MTIMIELSEATRDKLAERGSKEEIPEQIIARLLKLTESKSMDIPEEFSDYWQLEEYFSKRGFVDWHKTGMGSDSVKVRVVGTDNHSAFDLYYRLKDGKFGKCLPEESLDMIEETQGIEVRST